MKYAAYVGSFTFQGKSKGITIYDVDNETGRFVKRSEVEQDNCTYLCVSPDRKHLYAVVDEGVTTFAILPDGNLEQMKLTKIRGMRGCFMDVHPSGRFIAVAGYHDGKMTVLKVREDGVVGEITDEVYDKGIGSVAERNFRPHICCTLFSEDGKYLYMVDSGIDQVRIYAFSKSGRVELKDIIHSELGAGPHRVLFPKGEKHLYILHELKNTISVYDRTVNEKGVPSFEKVQEIATLKPDYTVASAACSLTFSPKQHHLYCSNAGENSIAFYDIDAKTGQLTLKNILPISGDYPIDIEILPDEKHLVSLNQDSNSLTFFTIDYHASTIVMNGLPIPCDRPNDCIIVPYGEE